MAATSPDVLLIQLGTNDGDTPKGAQADINNGATWWGRVNSVVTAVAAARPGMKIVFITPYQINPAAYPAKWDSTAPAKMADMVTAVKYICGLSGSTVVDMLHDSRDQPVQLVHATSGRYSHQQHRRYLWVCASVDRRTSENLRVTPQHDINIEGHGLCRGLYLLEQMICLLAARF